MTEPNRPDPVPAPPRAEDRADEDRAAEDGTTPSEETPFADLEQRPVSEHVDVFEAEHGRLQRELGTIDQL